jgi:uncharacterized membrane protein YphA (DoxX/SURF4 family)/thiol-disulfide isomerase/thioredoxin
MIGVASAPERARLPGCAGVRPLYDATVNAILLTTRCLLAVVFLVAAVGKLFDLGGSRQALEEFGMSAQVARLAGPVLPITELAIAAALLIRPSAVAGAVGALCLLLVFIAGVARAMSQGRAPDCHCFGQIHSEPAGRSTLIRNAVLGALAIVIMVGGAGPSLDGGLESLTGTQAALVVTAILAAVLAAALAQLWGDKRALEHDLEMLTGRSQPAGLPRGTTAPEFAVKAVRGIAGSLHELMKPGKPAVLVFVSTSCGPCLQMLPSLGAWQQSLQASLSLTAVFSGEATEIERLVDEHDLEPALAQGDDEVFRLYQLRATPSAVLIQPDGVIAGAAAEGVPAIEVLIRSALAQDDPAELVVHSG